MRRYYPNPLSRAAGASAPAARPAAPATNKRVAGASARTPGARNPYAGSRLSDLLRAAAAGDPRAFAEKQTGSAPQPSTSKKASTNSGAAGSGPASTRGHAADTTPPTPSVVEPDAVDSTVTDADPLSVPTTDGPTSGNGGDGPGSAADAGEATADATETKVDELTKLTNERDQYLQLAQRTQADFENFRKRKARDAELAESRANARFAKELLPALDNLGRALSHAAPDDPLLEGVRLVHTDLVQALARLGIESFSPEGEPFDPVEHEAVAQTPIEGTAAGTVVEVYQPGYRVNGTILRPARVVVAA